MDIRFISSLTADDENRFAPAVLKAVTALVDQLPLAYAIRIETSGAQVYQHTRIVPEERSDADAAAISGGLALTAAAKRGGGTNVY